MQYSIHTFGTTGLYTRDYSEQLWFPLNEIHQPHLLRVNQGKPQLQIKQLMGRARVMKSPQTPKPTARHHMTLIIHVVPKSTTGLYTRDYSEQLWFPLNEIHQPQLLRVNQGKPQLQIKQLMGRAGVMKSPQTPKPTARHHMTLIIHVVPKSMQLQTVLFRPS